MKPRLLQGVVQAPGAADVNALALPVTVIISIVRDTNAVLRTVWKRSDGYRKSWSCCYWREMLVAGINLTSLQVLKRM